MSWSLGPRAARGPRAPLAAGAALAAAVVVLAACGAGAEAGGEPAGPAAPSTDDASLVTVDPPQLATLDMAALRATPSATVVVGDGLTYAVTGQDCSLPGVRADAYAVRAHGRFCLVQVVVTNTGDAVERFTPDRARLVDVGDGAGQGDGLAPSAEALQLPPLAAMEADVPPATSLSGSLVYDVPGNGSARAVRFDGGPQVRLADVGGAAATGSAASG